MHFKLFIVLIATSSNSTLFSQSLIQHLSDHQTNVEAIAVSNNGKLLASGAWDGTINLYTLDSTNSPVLIDTYIGHVGAITGLCFSANNKYLVSCGKDYSSRVWNIDTPANHKVFNVHLEPVTCSFLDPKNKFLISSSLDGTIRFTYLNDPSKSKPVKVSGPVHDLTLSRDKKFYYVALKGGIIKKYQTSGKNLEVLSFSGHSDDVNDIELSPDGNFLASASNDKTILIWDLKSGKKLKTLEGFDWKVTSINYSSDGKYIIGGSNTGDSKLFDIETGALMSNFNDLGKYVKDVLFSKDGETLYVATMSDSSPYGLVLYKSGVHSEAKQTKVKRTIKSNSKK
jgi:WD40 repeat protein